MKNLFLTICFFASIICSQLFQKSYAQTSNVSITQALMADGGICNLGDTVKIAGALSANGVYQNTVIVTIDFGDGNHDTLRFPSPSASSMSKTFAFGHQYSSINTYQVKVKTFISNVPYDSAGLAISLGNCQKASGSFFYDLNNDCIQNDDECGYNNAFVNFSNNGSPSLVYIEPITGKFNIPIYPGDSYLPPSGILAQFFASVGSSCVGSSYPAIVGPTSNYKVRAIVNDPVWVTYFNGPTLHCKGSVASFAVNVSDGSDWKVRFDMDNGEGIQEVYSSCGGNFSCFSFFKSVTFPDTGTRTISAYSYRTLGGGSGVPYGPLSKKSVTVSAFECDTVILKPFIDKNQNCISDGNEYQLNGNNQFFLTLTSVKWGGNCPIAVYPNGAIGATLLPNDTVTFNKVNYYNTDYLWNNYPVQFGNIDPNSCGPHVFTNADDTVSIPLKNVIRIENLQTNAPGMICVGDSITYSFDVLSLGFNNNDSLRFIAIYSDGINDTNIIHSTAIDTFNIFGNKLITSSSSSITAKFVVQSMNGYVHSDTLYRTFLLNDCVKKTIKVYYDENKNCVKDANENYLNHFQISTSSFYTLSSWNNDSLIYTKFGSSGAGDTLQVVQLLNGSPMGLGYYNRNFTNNFCSWPVFTFDTTSFDIPLVDTLLMQNANITHGNTTPLTNNMPPCDTLYKPYLKANFSGNRNQIKYNSIFYNRGNGAPADSIGSLNIADNYDQASILFTINGPQTPYTAGTYIPSFSIKNSYLDTVARYVRPGNPLSVLQSCQGPKARIFTDNNSNCIFDTTDLSASNIMVQVNVNGQSNYITSNANGFIYFNANNGDNITINVPNTLNTGKSLNTNCVNNNYSFTYNSSSIDTILFAYDCSNNNNPLDVAITANHIGFATNQIDTISISPTFNNCDTLSGSISLALDPALNFLSSSLSNYQINGNTLSWQIDTLNHPIHYPIKVAVSVSGSSTANWLCNEVNITSSGNDVNLSNNTFTLCDTILPQIPLQFKSGLTDSIYLQPGTPVIYSIHFHNNTTDTVQHIVIVDSISPLLDISSLQINNSTHNFVSHIINNEVLKFTFDSVNLAPNSSGSIQFTISPLGNVPQGTQIHNKATIVMGGYNMLMSNTAILFAAPPPIDTGTNVTNPSLELLSIVAYPNPTNNLINIKVNGHLGNNPTLSIINTEGRILQTQKALRANNQMDMSRYPDGIYYIKYNDDKREAIIKIIKL